MSSSIQRFVIAGAAIGVFLVIRSRGKDLFVATALIWLAGSYVGTQVPGRHFYHYYAPVVVPAAILLVLPWRQMSDRMWARVALGMSSLVVASVVAAPFLFELQDRLEDPPRTTDIYDYRVMQTTLQGEIIDLLRKSPNSRATLFVTEGEPIFYWLSGLEPATEYLYDYPREIIGDFDERVNQQLQRNPPRFLVTRGNELPPYASSLRYRPYELVARIGPIQLRELQNPNE